jgi:hypothetical protein
MCDVCGAETGRDGKYEVRMGKLETVSKFDGGLSRDRLAMLSDERDGEVNIASRRYFFRTPRRLRGRCQLGRDLKLFINGSSGGSVLYPRVPNM